MRNKLKTNWNEILASEDVNDMYGTFTAKLKNIYNLTSPVVSLNRSLLGKYQTSMDDSLVKASMQKEKSAV